MKIAFACDQGGYPLREAIISHLKEKDYEILDFGIDSQVSVDYPDYAQQVAEAVAAGHADLGILVCGTGIGMSIAANKVPGIRCALLSDPYSAEKARQHNNANVIALGGRVLGDQLALSILDHFLAASFEGGRHDRRLGKIMQYEQDRLAGKEQC